MDLVGEADRTLCIKENKYCIGLLSHARFLHHWGPQGSFGSQRLERKHQPRTMLYLQCKVSTSYLVLLDVSFDENSISYNHPLTQVAQFDTASAVLGNILTTVCSNKF